MRRILEKIEETKQKFYRQRFTQEKQHEKLEWEESRHH